MLIGGRQNFVDKVITKEPWIETHGKEWFDSGLTGNGGLRAVIDFEYTELPQESSQGTLFGWVTSAGDRMFVNRDYVAQKFQMGYGSGINYIHVGENISAHSRFLIDANLTSRKLKFVLNGETLFTSSKVISHPTYLKVIVNRLAYNGSGNVNGLYATGGGHVKYYSLKFYDGNDNLVRDFVPMQENGIAYFFDRVNSKKYANQGAGAFTYREG